MACSYGHLRARSIFNIKAESCELGVLLGCLVKETHSLILFGGASAPNRSSHHVWSEGFLIISYRLQVPPSLWTVLDFNLKVFFRDVTSDQWGVMHLCWLVTIWCRISANNSSRIRDVCIAREYSIHSNWDLLVLFRYAHTAAYFGKLISDLKGVRAIRTDIAVRRQVHRHAGLRCSCCGVTVACHVLSKCLRWVQALVILQCAQLWFPIQWVSWKGRYRPDRLSLQRLNSFLWLVLDCVEHLVSCRSILNRHVRLYGCCIDLEHLLCFSVHLLLDVAQSVIICVTAILSSSLPECLLLSTL